MAYLGLHVGDPFAWPKSFLFAWGHISILADTRLNPATFEPGNFNLVLFMNVIVGVGFTLAAIPVSRLLGVAYAAFTLVCIVTPLIAGADGLGRYASVVFPVFVVLAYYFRRGLVTNLVLGGSAALLGLLTVLFANGYWIV
jgi:hypothetical protein